MGDSQDEEYYEEAFENYSDQDQSKKPKRGLTDFELINDVSPKDEEEEILLENKQAAISPKKFEAQNMEEDLDLEESKSDQRYENRGRPKQDQDIPEQIKPSAAAKDRVAKSADRGVPQKKFKKSPTFNLGQAAELKRENVFSEKIKEIIKDTDYQRSNEGSIIKENAKLREVLKQLNVELSKIIEQQAVKIPVKKEQMPSKRISSAKIKTMLEEIKNNKKLIANLNEEMDRLTKRVTTISDPGYYERLLEKINERRKIIEETKKYNKNAVWDNKKQGKNLDHLENVTGPETLKKINELNVELISTNKKNVKMKDKVEELEKQSDDLGTKLVVIDEKYQKALVLADHYKIFRKDIKNADKYDELTKKLKSFERNKATFERKLEQMTETYRKGIEDVRKGIKEIEAACTEKEIEINKQQYEIKDLLSKESINKDLLLKIKFNMATTPRKIQRNQDEADASVKSHETNTENQFFKENILDDVGGNIDIKMDEREKTDVAAAAKKEEDRSKKKKSSQNREAPEKGGLDSPRQVEQTEGEIKSEEKQTQTNSVKSLPGTKKAHEETGELAHAVKSESRNAPEDPISHEISKSEQHQSVSESHRPPEDIDKGEGGKNHREELENKAKTDADENRRASNYNPPTKPNFKKRTKQDSGNYSGMGSTQDQQTNENSSNISQKQKLAEPEENSHISTGGQRLIDPNTQTENRTWNQKEQSEPKLFNFKKKKENNSSFSKDTQNSEIREESKPFSLNEEIDKPLERKSPEDGRESRENRPFAKSNENRESEEGTLKKPRDQPEEKKEEDAIPVYTNTNSRRTNARTFKKEDDTSSSYMTTNKADPMKKIMDPFAKYEDINNLDFSKKERKLNLFSKEEGKGPEFEIPTVVESKKKTELPGKSEGDIFEIPEIKPKEEPAQEQNKFSRAFELPKTEKTEKEEDEWKGKLKQTKNDLDDDFLPEKKPQRVIENGFDGPEKKPGRFKMADNEQKTNKEKQKTEKQKELAEKAEKAANDLFEELDF